MTFERPAAPGASGQNAGLSTATQIDLDAWEAASLRRQGLSLWAAGALVEATECLQGAERLAPANPRIMSDLGSLLYATGRPAEAVHYLSKSLKIDPSHPQTWLVLANAAHTFGDMDIAEQAFLAALDIAPNAPGALMGLGLLHFELRRFESAERLLSIVVSDQHAAGPAIYACLGDARRMLGQFSQAREAFQKAAAGFPLEAAIQRKYARVGLIDAAIEEPVEAALQVYEKAAGCYAEDVETVLRDALQALCGFGHAAGAIRVAKALLDLAPNDPVVRYHLDALQGTAHRRAPNAYLTACFDKFAPNFETQLIDVLGYSVPSTCENLLSETGRSFDKILDLGCGTGLAAPFLARLGEELTGVDISPGMLEKARERGLYHRLLESEAGAFLAAGEERFDLVTALDVLVYFGDLSDLFEQTARRLTPGGLFALSVETGEGADYRLRPCGRFTHAPDYVAATAARHFDTLARVATTIRLEANAPVAGEVVVLRRL
ncbi:methyltransferase domain-containing protein [Methylocystis sp. MJC1]|jgi:predicted TPR repeat methyltransferase/Flp pilus assembly protein TadD|uniref:methyltransferase domain-containing protein n=1 Tax=Methylocystis sp. MJC1 TaxID=2654282 RepID=UPI0013EBB20C|nr:tetratricopeptide repeat protein [Methylocystis sp. MJC1]KAF2989393.1 Magnesium-protoporphyrin O-methyltransferase [Methylocystis sp. MJC1]MBU6526858.1 methyltransferase domain-containing protein [Methylocystis sp. MJC1]UZX13296.1 methyltransferase domain-containing protein [Methylocystis sp. MJC1]